MNYRPPITDATKKTEFHLIDGLSLAQGPNYALAKRLQSWRAIVAREDHNSTVSANIGPGTATDSVIHARTFRWAYGGLSYFKPYEVFETATSKAAMFALLIHDVRNERGAARPTTQLDNPNLLLTSEAFHGGVWRGAYKITSMGEVSVMMHFVRKSKWYVLAGALLCCLVMALAVPLGKVL
eukprot:Selendium_serpulae@DN6453_c1_g2_i3.p2